MVLNLSMVPNPSGLKLDNLPSEFQLDKIDTGKYLETWRRNHFRPKLRDNEELDLEASFERRYRAAPVAQDRELELWFTTPPKVN